MYMVRLYEARTDRDELLRNRMNTGVLFYKGSSKPLKRPHICPLRRDGPRPPRPLAPDPGPAGSRSPNVHFRSAMLTRLGSRSSMVRRN
ncbi:hypothetical protein EVAR_96419_1 [Eumeta japonica]|uniref:Uncharacterized protein n=1 Tax=Eumeta variegata TaxID=151549 RepID=A0A4C1WBW3_EUMVA|nr:hypothetical protein EVAR_96419_1 [Eumeta japonica]